MTISNRTPFILLYSILLAMEELFIGLHLIDESVILYIVFSFMEHSYVCVKNKKSKEQNGLLFHCILLLLGSYLATVVNITPMKIIILYLFTAYMVLRLKSPRAAMMISTLIFLQFVLYFFRLYSVLNACFLGIFASSLYRWFSLLPVKPLFELPTARNIHTKR